MDRDRDPTTWAELEFAMLVLLLYVATVFLCHADMLGIPFVADDNIFIGQRIATFKEGLLAYMRLAPDRPLGMAAIWVNFMVGGADPAAFRVPTFVLHALTGFVLFKLLWLLGQKHLGLKTPWMPAAVALMFVVHPVHAQALLIVCQRCVVLAGLFSLLTFYWFARFVFSGGRWHYLASVACFFFALASKANSMAMAAILVLYVLGFHRARFLELRSKLLPYVVGLALPLVCYKYLDVNQQSALPWLDYLRTELRVIFIYFRIFFVPTDLHYLYDVDAQVGWLAPWTLAAIAGHLGILGLAVWLWIRRTGRFAAFSVIGVYLALAPESSVFPIHYVLWEYRTYLPLAFVSVWALTLGRKVGAENTRLLIVPFLALVGAMVLADRAADARLSDPKGWAFGILKYNAKDFHYNIEFLDVALDVEDVDAGTRGLEMITESDSTRPDYVLYREAFRYLSDPPGQRVGAKLLDIGAKLLQSQAFPVSDSTILALNRLLYRHLGEHFKGVEFYRRLEEVSFPQMQRIYLKGLRSNFSMFYSNYVEVLRWLDDYCVGLEAKRPLGPVDEALHLKVLAEMEIFFGRSNDHLLGMHFDDFLKKHPDDAQTSLIYEWYRRARR